ncbi:hypothetical protein ABRN95_002391 [Listeria monocytogenes]
MTEKEQNQLSFYRTFYHVIWESGWMNSDAKHELTKQVEQESGFDADGEDVEKVGDDE